MAYLRSTVDFGLHYTTEVPVDEDPDLARRRPRKGGTLEVLVDASFSPGDSHSVSGTIILLGGCPVQWECKKQSLMALSTAEAELTALVEGLQTGRSVRALALLLMEEVSLEIYNDNRAAVVLASGSGGGWRTRHLRIRASCLAEALRNGELTLNHRSGLVLWADALTKALPTIGLERFCKGILLGPEVVKEEVKTGTIQAEEGVKISKCMAMMLAGASLLPQVGGSEVCEKGENESSTSSSMMGDVGWLVLLAGLVCLLQMIKDLGLTLLRRLVSGQENVKVKLLSTEATMPKKGSGDAAGWDISTSMAVKIAPGERKLVSTGVALEIPKGSYGRVASRSSLALCGLDVAGGVIDSDYRGEVKIILSNQGSQERSFEVGDRVAQIVIEKISSVPWVQTAELSRSFRGEGGFGSSGAAVRSMRLGAEDSTEGEPQVPEGGLFDRGSQLHEGVRRGEGSLNQEEDLCADEPHVHEGGLSRRGLHVPGRNAPRDEVSRDSQVSEVGVWPRDIQFAVHTSQGGESMPVFLERLLNSDLREVRWMFPEEVINIVSFVPVNGTPYECVVRFPEGIVSLKIHRHGGWRRKLFDSELSVPLCSSGVSSKVVTIAWCENGRKVIRCDLRKGSHGMSYLQQKWSGFSILARASPVVAEGERSSPRAT